MAKKEKKRANEKVRPPKANRRAQVRSRQQSASIYFLLWTAFALLSVVIVLFLGISQRSMFVQTYKDEAHREITQKGMEIQRAVENPPSEVLSGNNFNGYVRFLSNRYGVDIWILDEEGNVVHPREPNVSPDSPEYKEYYYFEEELAVLLKKLSKAEGGVAYEGEGEYVYGAKLSLYGNVPSYLYVSRSLSLMQSAIKQITGRTVLLAVFVFVLSFALSSAVAGWLVNPLSELTKKAHKLAQGDFDVDFHGNDYGRELVELADSLNFARDELSKSDRMQKELIANVSHDFKTPLTMIKGYASMIIEISGNNPEKRNKHAQIIVDEADRLASLVSDVLDLSKIQSGIAQLELSEVDMTAYLKEIMERFAYLKDTQGYRFKVSADEGLCTRADRLKLGQVLYNLIGNAVNYTGADKLVKISLREEGEFFRFAVSDTGKGIPPEELSGIWERYYRSSEAHKRPVQGTGLGLSIVKTILERHGFLYGVESRLGEGSTFYVIFPRVQSSDGA